MTSALPKPRTTLQPINQTLYAAYLAERSNAHILENENGFIVYRIDADGSLYIIDMYIKPESRKAGKARKLLNELEALAVANGFERITAAIYTEDPTSNNTLICALAGGFRIGMANGGVIGIVKHLKQEAK